MRKWLGGAVVALALTLTGCGGKPSNPVPPPAGGPGPTAAQEQQEMAVPALPAAEPTGIEIPKIKAKSTLVPLGLNQDGTIEVPPVSAPMQAGWYTKAPTPGEIGPAVILGHVDGNKQPGIFYRLKEMATGDEILVSRKDGSTARFLVAKVDQVSKKDFPSDKVYGDVSDAELRLITCGGVFDRTAHSYEDNVIVYAVYTPA
ncbi:class F sortase [Actinocrispum wychmicini]|uniref:LPXTG-site transpeptidase (Sortase) family protein n=1 Tax=Actinocrispum wychmicini TaxID=1213861 RepID=A0A4R2K6X2_9PSEU|nr:class F sortase [Actinocrispum wychmicini]TCO65578.1 LPXTG-site transpeptidase (sortase) family protein [Actinocrispum wychmicini]